MGKMRLPEEFKEFINLLNINHSFKKNPLTNNIYDIFRYKTLRKKIYNEIEYRYKLLLKNEYSYLINKDRGRNNGS
jgi:hypothetical protein